MWFLCLSRSIYLFFLVLFSFLALVFLFRLSFYLTVSLYVLSLRWPWSLSWACKMCEICVEEKSFYIQIIMKNKGIEEASGAHTFPEKKKKKRIFRRLQLLPFKLSSFAPPSSSLVICLQVPRYICYLIKTARK